jgi:hypothetical protein
MAMSGVIAFVWIIRTVLAYFALRGTKQNEGIALRVGETAVRTNK